MSEQSRSEKKIAMNRERFTLQQKICVGDRKDERIGDSKRKSFRLWARVRG